MKTPHLRVWAVGTAATTAGLGLGLPASLAYADPPASTPIAVINGDFTQPAIVGDGPDSTAVKGWSVGSTDGAGTVGGVVRYPGTVSGHPDHKPAVMLRLPAPENAFKQRLRGVRAGAKVTITFDDSPGIATKCAPAAVAQGQAYTVQGAGGPVSERTTAPDPDKKANTLGKGVWRIGQTYTFTAGETEPLLTFTSQVPASANATGWCGPLIAKVQATQIPPPVDKTIPKTALPASEAFRGNDRRSVADAVSQCAGAPGACTFTPETAYSYSYFEPAQLNGDVYINCTRNTLTRTRPVPFTGRSYGDLPALAGLPGTGSTSTNMAKQFTAGTRTGPRWTTDITHSVTEIVKPGEVAWIETQAGRRRTEGWFTTSPDPDDPHTQWRLHTVLDYPAPDLTDRFYQRTGPLTSAEKQRCQSDRPTASTPVGADTPAGGGSTLRLSRTTRNH
ncbi:hypothetical protein AB0L00_43365 [Actinoallomurus sp. NPDC052308]|uniref:hypothetical protein n=1 Tax=Actinoallomurus sp. NPDC052308 TaxID=3155530 RepID=UPI00341248D2